MLMIGFLRLMALATAVAMVTTMSVSAAEIQVMSGGAPKEVFALLAPRFEQQTGNKVAFTYAVIAELREKLRAGATADVLVLPTAVLDSLAKEGNKAHRNRIFQARKSFATRCWLRGPWFRQHREKRRAALTWAR
jgi:ABC-type molybdate transport system substrate-binding protein